MKGNILKATGQKLFVTFSDAPVRLEAEFSLEIMEATVPG